MQRGALSAVFSHVQRRKLVVSRLRVATRCFLGASGGARARVRLRRQASFLETGPILGGAAPRARSVLAVYTLQTLAAVAAACPHRIFSGGPLGAALPTSLNRSLATVVVVVLCPVQSCPQVSSFRVQNKQTDSQLPSIFPSQCMDASAHMKRAHGIECAAS